MQTDFNLQDGVPPAILTRPLEERDLPTADQIVRLAFGTFLGLPDPMKFLGEGDYVRTRRKSNPEAAFCAEVNGILAGSAFAGNWGSVGFIGPVSVHPALWDRGVAKKLMEPVMACFDIWGTRQTGLFTFPGSSKHLGLYQKFGFWPQFLTAILSKPTGKIPAGIHWSTYSDAAEGEKQSILSSCSHLTDRIYEGLDVSLEIESVNNQRLGDTLLLGHRDQLEGFAVCHYGPGTEAAAGAFYIKFAAVSPGKDSPSKFLQLLQACEEKALDLKLSRIIGGVNTARQEAYQLMLGYGYRASMYGVIMQKPNQACYHRPGVYVLDDWR